MQLPKHFRRLACTLALATALWHSPQRAGAHEDHDALPSKGAAVHGEEILLSPGAIKALGLETSKVALGPWKKEIGANAVVETPCHRHAFASTLIEGKLAQIFVRPGDRVEAGQELARIESLELETLEANLLVAAAEQKLAEQLLEQRTALARENTISQKDLQAAQAAARQKTAQFEIARLKLSELGLADNAIDEVLQSQTPLRTLPIASPLAGVVSLANVQVGQVVRPLEAIFQIVDLSHVLVAGEVLESDVSEVRQDMPARFVPAADPRAERTGALTHLGLKIDPQRRTFSVWVALDNSDGALRAGAFGRLYLQAEAEPEAVLCPLDAIFKQGDRDYVLLRKNANKFVRRRVQVIGRSGEYAAIADGVFPGHRVVTTGAYELASLFAAEHEPEAARGRNSLAGAGPAISTSPANPKPAATIVAQGRIELPKNRKWLTNSTIVGRIAKLAVHRGDRVRAGQLLAQIESLELTNLELDFLDTRARLALARKTLDRVRTLGEEELVSRQQVWQLTADYRELDSRSQSLSQKLAVAGLQPEQISRLAALDLSRRQSSGDVVHALDVRAPADGWVADFELSIGQVVHPADPLFEIQQPEKIWLHAFVFEADADRIRLGQRVDVTAVAAEQLKASGVIERVSPVLEGNKRALSVWAELDNPIFAFKENMFIRAVVTVDPPVAGAQAASARLEK